MMINKKILIVEDDEISRYLLEIYLRDHHQLCFASDGKQAVELVNKEKVPFDLVIMDLQLPKVDGFEASEQIKKLFPNLKIIAITALSTNHYEDIDLFDDYIQKPCTQETVVKKVNSFLT